MKTLIQRILTSLAAVLLTAIGASAFDFDFEADGYYYKIVPDGVEVTDGPRTYTDDIRIPAKVTYNDVEYDVVGVGDMAFERQSSLRTVTMEGPVKYIGNSCFKLCNNLCNITIPPTVESIGEYCFYECRSLSSINIPSNVTIIPDYAFHRCIALSSVSHGGNIRIIGRNAFYETNLTEFDFNDGLIEIGLGAFSKTKLTSFTVPETLKILQGYAFANTRIQNNIDIPPSVEVIGWFAFANTRITRINVPATVKYLGYRFAADCGFLTEVVLDCEVEAEPLVGDRGAYLGYGSDFYPLLSDCRGLSTVKIFGNIRNIQGGAFMRVGIRDLYLGKNIEVISESAFLDSSIQNIYFLSENPPIIGKYFRGWAYDFPYMLLGYEYDEQYVSLTSATLKTNYLSGTVNVHIPQGSLEAYRSSGLSSLMCIKFIEDLPSSSIDEIVADNDTEITVADGRIIADGVVEVYATDGRLVGRGLSDDLPTLTPGLYVVRTTSAAKKIIVR